MSAFLVSHSFVAPLPRPDRGNLCMCRLAGLGGAAKGDVSTFA